VFRKRGIIALAVCKDLAQLGANVVSRTSSDPQGCDSTKLTA